jgi:cysteinyl-tRNA synthetase
LKDSQRAVGRLRELGDRLTAPTTLGGTAAMGAAVSELETRVRDALFDDLNAPQALAAVFDFVHAANADLDRRGTDRTALDQAASALEFIESTLGIVPARLNEDAVRPFVEGRLRDRQAARARGDFATADSIRAELEAKGIAISDTGAGTSWKLLR